MQAGHIIPKYTADFFYLEGADFEDTKQIGIYLFDVKQMRRIYLPEIGVLTFIIIYRQSVNNDIEVNDTHRN